MVKWEQNVAHDLCGKDNFLKSKKNLKHSKEPNFRANDVF